MSTPASNPSNQPGSKYGPGGLGGFILRTAAVVTGGLALIGVLNILFGWNLTYRRIDLPKTWPGVLILGAVSAVLGYLYYTVARRKAAR